VLQQPHRNGEDTWLKTAENDKSSGLRTEKIKQTTETGSEAATGIKLPDPLRLL
jgi:hypothetical protein